MSRLAEIASETPGVKDTFAIAGFSVLTGDEPVERRRRCSSSLDRLRRARASIRSSRPTAILGQLMRRVQPDPGGLRAGLPAAAGAGHRQRGGFKIQVQDRTGARTPQELQAATEQLIAAARAATRQLAGAVHAASAPTSRSSTPTSTARKVKKQDVAVTDVFDTLQVYLGSLYVNDFNFLGRTYR